MNTNKKLIMDHLPALEMFQNTFPDSFTGAGLKDIYLPDFAGQRITVMLSTSYFDINQLQLGTNLTHGIRYNNVLIQPNVYLNDDLDVVFEINKDSFLGNYNVDNPDDAGIIKNTDFDINIDSDVPFSCVVNCVASSISESSITIDASQPYSIIPISENGKTGFFVGEPVPAVGDKVSPKYFNQYRDTISFFNVDDGSNPHVRITPLGNTIKIQGSDTNGGDSFGNAVIIKDNLLIVSAYLQDSISADAGSVYIYDLENLREIRIQGSYLNGNDAFGNSIFLKDNLLFVGAYKEDVTDTNSGSVYIYDISKLDKEFIMNSEIRLIPQTNGQYYQFGNAVVVENNNLVVASNNSGINGKGTGAVFIYDISVIDADTILNSEIRLQATDNADYDYFGTSISIYNNILAIGSPGEDDTHTSAGSIYLYDISSLDYDTIRATEIKLQSTDVAKSDGFGNSIFLKNNKLYVGSKLSDFTGSDGLTKTNAGSVYIYDISNFNHDDIISTEIKLFRDIADSSDYFGNRIYVYDNILAVGAVGNLAGGNGGAVYLYDITNLNATDIMASEKVIIPEDVQSEDEFGISLCVDNNNLAIGSYSEDTNGTNAGSVYLYDLEKI
jgi:hypothetical protein